MTRRRKSTWKRRLRLGIEQTVLLVVAGLVFRTWCIEGLFIPRVVASGSMAPTLLGPHYRITCADCGRPIVWGVDAGFQPSVICPQCGFENEIDAAETLTGDMLLVDKAAFEVRSPRRWEVIAFRHPGDASRMCVKRVVGLPGETVEIRRGDVYVDGRIQRKGLEKLRAMAVLVYDTDFLPRREPKVPHRWRAISSESRWQRPGLRFSAPAGSSDLPIDWLAYQHWQRVPGKGDEVVASPIFDRCGYNQQRPQNAVTDVLFTFRWLSRSGTGSLHVRVTDGTLDYRVELDPAAGTWAVFLEDEPVGSGTSNRLPPCGEGLEVAVGLYDCQFVLALGGEGVYLREHNPPAELPAPPSQPVALGVDRLGVVVDRLRIWRDVYYTHPIGRGGGGGGFGPVCLAEDAYFVLGDNSPVSEDSRSGLYVSPALLVGKPFLVHLPSERVPLGGVGIQVPDWSRIRYIR